MNKTDYKDMWVFIERDGDSVLPVSLELCSETRRLCDASGEKLVAVIVGSISDGELQRVLLALALEPMPNMLILDEPLSGVDVEGMALLMDMLDGIRKKFDLSILMTTHDFSMLEKYADRVVLLRERVLCEGTPEQVLSSDAFAEVFHMRGGKAQ